MLAENTTSLVIAIGNTNDEPDLFTGLCEAIPGISHHTFSDRYSLLVLNTLSEVLECAATRDVPLIVVGYDSPDGNGLSLAKELKQQCPQSVVLVILPYDSVELQDQVRSSGIDRLLARPFDFEAYEHIVRDVLNKHVESALQMPVSISPTAIDRIVSITKGGLGAIPLVGSLAAEVVGNLIPNQRIDRIETYLHILAAKVQASEEHLRQRFHNPEFVDLFEDSMYQAARALSEERLHYIAALLKNSLSDEEVKHLQDKHLLQLLGELNDAEVILLKSKSFRAMGSPELVAFYEQHATILKPRPVPINSATPGDVDRSIIYRAFNQHLMKLGLLKGRFREKKKGEFEFDEDTGTLKADGYEATSLGRLLLRRIDLIEETT